jgi:peptidoglycan/LPS O-acetylase OafA/YrhL
MKMIKRYDIQGIRALAVLFVIIFHIDKEYLPSGFIGVDIFFVISGFLMTLILSNDFSLNNKINLFKFYMARIKRIVPALYTMLVICFIIGILIFDWFYAMRDFFNIHRAFNFTSNLYYIENNTSYWDSPIYISPFLHTWSLSVEWQFYIFYPLICILFLNSFKLNYLIILNILLSLFSLYFIYKNINNTNTIFYHTYSRIFQMGFGGIVACLITQYSTYNTIKFPSYIINIINVSLLGLLIVLSMISLQNNHYIATIKLPIPLIISLLTGLLIFFSSFPNITHKLTQHKIMQFIGDRSYSMYLYHFPIYVFTLWITHIIFLKDHLNMISKVLIFFITFICSMISFKYIETPAKKYKHNHIILICIALILISANTIGSLRNKVVNAQSIALSKKYLTDLIQIDNFNNIQEVYIYNMDRDEKNFDLLFIGDSQVSNFAQSLLAYAKKNNLKLKIILGSGCGHNPKQCHTFYKNIDETLKQSKYKYLIIANRDYLINTSLINIILQDYIIEQPIFILHNIKQPKTKIPEYLSRRQDSLLFANVKFNFSNDDNNTSLIEESVEPLTNMIKNNFNPRKTKNITIIDLNKYLTSSIKDNIILFRNSAHLSPKGAEYLVPYFLINFHVKK